MTALLVTALSVFAQKAKAPTPAVAWTYETPPGFQLLEPTYRFPSQIKQALLQFVQPSPALCREYQAVFLDKRKFSVWLKSVLLAARARRTKAVKEDGEVLSSDPSMMSPGGGTILSTAWIPPAEAEDPEGIELYLDVLKIWAPESGR